MACGVPSASPGMKRPEPEQLTRVGGQTLGSQILCWWGEGWSPLGRQRSAGRGLEPACGLPWPLGDGLLVPGPLAPHRCQKPAWSSCLGQGLGAWPLQGAPPGVGIVAVSRSAHPLVARSVW